MRKLMEYAKNNACLVMAIAIPLFIVYMVIDIIVDKISE